MLQHTVEINFFNFKILCGGQRLTDSMQALQPLGTRQKTRSHNPGRKLYLKTVTFYTSCMNTKFTNQSLKAYYPQTSIRKHAIYFGADSSGADPVSFKPWVWMHRYVQSQAYFRRPVSYHMHVFPHSTLQISSNGK